MMVKYPAEIQDLSDFDESVNMLVYADSGVGKTVFAGTAPNALFLSTETGTISAKRMGSEAKVWRIKRWGDLDKAYTWLERNPDHGFDFIILDSATQMQVLLLRWILEKENKRNPAKRDLDIPAIQDHQKWQNMFKRFITLFVELPVHVIFTAQAMRKEDEEGDDLVLPLIDGKGYGISSWVCGQMHIVGYYYIKPTKKGPERRLLAQSHPPYFAKDRYNVLVPWVGNPTVPSIMAKIEHPALMPATTKKAKKAKKKEK
jgi:hypothetical protein